jgi:simple sugar transport system substrate-binding protein
MMPDMRWALKPSSALASSQAIAPWSGACSRSPHPTAGVATFTGYVSAHPDVKLIVTDHGAVTGTAETYLKAAGKKAGDIKMAGFDLSAPTVAAIQGGWENLVIDQQEWLQGYLPILQLCLTKVYGFSGLNVNTGAGFVDKSNVDFIAPLAAKNIR